MTAELRVQLFGPFAALLNGAPLPGLSEHRKAEQLLALMCLYPDKERGNEAIAAQLWPDSGSIDNLKHSVCDLRRAFGSFAERLVGRAGKLSLDLSGVEVDVIAFDRACANAGRDVSALADAIELYRGPLLQDWFEDWVETARKGYEVKYREALTALADSAIQSENYEAARRYLERLTQLLPNEYAPRLRLMAVLVESGEYLAAKTLYEEYRDYLWKVHRLSPPKPMTQLFEQIPRPSQRVAPSAAPILVEEEPIGGAMQLHSVYYIARPSDRIVHSAVKRRDCIVRIQGPRQTGKTSLLARVLHQARQDGALVVTTDFQALGPQDTETIDALFLALAHQFHRAANASVAPSEFWDKKLSANANLQGYIRDVVLEEAKTQVVWGIDEADRIFDREYHSSVFGLFRSWHNRRSLEPNEAWGRFTLLMAYSAEAQRLISNPHESPFNVGVGTALQDFTPEQVVDLMERYGPASDNEWELAPLMAFAGGHPFLVRSCLYEMKTRPAAFGEIVAESLRDDSLFAEHLHRILRMVSGSPEWCQVVVDLLEGKPCANLDTFSHLRSAGVLAGASLVEARFRCGLYETYLKRRLL